MHELMPAELLSRVAYTATAVCMHCGASEGHEEVVWTGDDGEDYGGKKTDGNYGFAATLAVMRTCHAKRFTHLRLKVAAEAT